MNDEHLYVAVNACANANRGDADAFSNELCDFARDHLEHDGKSPSFLERQGIIQQFASRLGGLPLDAVSSQLVDRLRCEAYVTHHSDLFVDQALYQREPLTAAFEFD